MKYSDLKTYLLGRLVDTPYEGVAFYPGPDLPDIPERHVVLTPVPGPGLSVEGLFDAQGWQVRSVGEQDSYDDGEALAALLDSFLRSENGRMINGVRTVSSQRSGGSPYPLYKDDGERVHFVCNYNFDVQL